MKRGYRVVEVRNVRAGAVRPFLLLSYILADFLRYHKKKNEKAQPLPTGGTVAKSQPH